VGNSRTKDTKTPKREKMGSAMIEYNEGKTGKKKETRKNAGV